MMQGPIRRVPRETIEPRTDARLPSAWIEESATRGEVSGLSWFQFDAKPVSATAATGAPVIAMLAAEDGPALREILAPASAGERVYLIVPPGWGKNQLDTQLLACPRVLIRCVPEVPTTGVSLGGSARLWVGGKWSLRLDDSQTVAFRQVFLRLFWHNATEEAWTGGRQLVWRAAKDRPFDVPELQRAAPLRLMPANAQIGIDLHGGLLHLTSGAPPDIQLRRLWYPAGGDHHERISKVARNGAQVVWEDRGLPDLGLNSASGEALLPGALARLRILLTTSQAAEAARILEAPARWRFRVDLRLGDASHANSVLWLPGEVAGRRIEREQSIELPDVSADSLRAVHASSPENLPPSQPLALSARYRWTVLPPRLPAGSEEDPLVGRWRRIDEEWGSRIAKAGEALQTADGRRGRIASAFARLVGAMLGFERTHAGLREQLTTMLVQRPSSAGPASAATMLSSLAGLEDAVRRLVTELDETERKARENEDREKQEAAWKTSVDTAKRDLPSRRAAQRDAEARVLAITQDLANLEPSLQAADKEARKDLAARKQKQTDDLARTNKEAIRLRAEVASLEKQSAERFEFRPSTPQAIRAPKPTGRFVPPTPDAIQASGIPEQALPEVGVLRSHRGQRYLAIATWEELTVGEQAAKRLSAKLVGPENA